MAWARVRASRGRDKASGSKSATSRWPLSSGSGRSGPAHSAMMPILKSVNEAVYLLFRGKPHALRLNSYTQGDLVATAKQILPAPVHQRPVRSLRSDTGRITPLREKP